MERTINTLFFRNFAQTETNTCIAAQKRNYVFVVMNGYFDLAKKPENSFFALRFGLKDIEVMEG